MQSIATWSFFFQQQSLNSASVLTDLQSVQATAPATLTDLHEGVWLADAAHEGAAGHGLLVERDWHTVRLAGHRDECHVVQTTGYGHHLMEIIASFVKIKWKQRT